MSKPRRVTAPSVQPWDLGLFKEHARIDGADSDDIATAYLAAATARLDGHGGILGRCLINQEWEIGLGGWTRVVDLPFPDVTAAEVTYVDGDGASQTVASDDFEIIEIARGSQLRFVPSFSEPALSAGVAEPITVAFTAGYGASAEDVPASIRIAIMQMAATWHRYPETLGEGDVLPLSSEALIKNHRMVAP